PTLHYEQIKKALKQKKHVLCESPITLKRTQYEELLEIANRNNCVLMESLKTAYSTAYERLLLLIKCGVIGEVVSIDSTCTSLKELSQFSVNDIEKNWNSICSWGPMAMLPIFQILGVDYKSKHISSVMFDKKRKFDLFTKVDFLYDNAVASIKVGKGVKSEGELVISGTKGYVYVPAPWWKTEYFEIRFENQTQNQRYFYQLDGEGYRYELIEFVRNIESGRKIYNINNDVSKEICGVIEDFYSEKDFINITLKK
ncbi:MAG: Gfo/Idh/MocA family oxidoreductase, partial [Clostridia bacterium]|nr:Gfo/Idh/MocA family oxidoreductase [Clostridia bacterium]